MLGEDLANRVLDDAMAERSPYDSDENAREHHVEEEEKEMFPKAKKSKVDLEALGAEMAAFKANLVSTA